MKKKLRTRIWLPLSIILLQVIFFCSCEVTMWSSDIESFVEDGLSNIILTDQSTDYLTSDTTTSVELTLSNPSDLSADCTFNTDSSYISVSNGLILDDVLYLDITTTSDADLTESQVFIDITATLTGREYETQYLDVLCNNTPGEVDLTVGTSDDFVSVAAFTLPDDEDLVTIGITYHLVDELSTTTVSIDADSTDYSTAIGSLESNFEAYLSGNDYFYFTPPGASTAEQYSYSITITDSVGQISDVVTGSNGTDYYSLTWDGNGGIWSDGTSDSLTEYVEGDTSVTTPTSEDISWEYHTLIGWSDDAGDTWDTDVDVTIESDTTFTAVWSEDEYTVTWDTNGGSWDSTTSYSDSMTVGVSESYTITMPNTSDINNDYYALYGWSDGSTVYMPGVSVDISGDMSFTAVWDAADYTVTWEPDGGTWSDGSTDSYSVTIGSSDGYVVTTLSSDDISRDYYTLTGWSDGTTTYSDLGIDGVTISEDTTLTAVWEEAEYTVTWDTNGGSWDSTTSYSDSMTVGVSESYTITMANTSDINNDYYVLYGWSDGSTVYMPGVSVDISSDMSFTAVWDAADYTVTWEPDGGTWSDGTTDSYSVTIGSSDGYVVTTLSSDDITRDDYTLTGWSDGTTTYSDLGIDTVSISEDTTLSAVWTEEQYTVTWDTNGGSWESSTTYTDTMTIDENDSYTITIPTSSDISYENYDYDGWVDDSGTTYSAGDTVVISSDTSLTAQWSGYTITYHNGFDSGDDTATEGWGYGASATIRTASEMGLTNSGYTFAGWSGDSSEEYTTDYYDVDDDSEDVLTISNLSSDMDIYAVWVAGTPIRTVTELEYLNSQNSSYVYSGWDTDYYLTKDLDLSSYSYNRIGDSSSEAFEGFFDGLNHSLSDADISINSSKSGLFGYLTGTVQNLTVNDITITSSADYIGVIAGYINGGTITSCTISGTIYCDEGDFIGGLAGGASLGSFSDNEIDSLVIVGSDDSSNGFINSNVGGYIGYVTDCEISGTNIIDTVSISYTYGNTGGFIGFAEDCTINKDDADSTQVITVSIKYPAGGYNGGFIGNLSDSTIQYVDVGTVSIISPGSANNGGLMGSASSCTLSDCNLSSLSMSLNSTSYGGGAFGYLETSYITKCDINSVDISGGTLGIGGFAGSLSESSVSECTVVNDGLYASGMWVGGFIGYGDFTTTSNGNYSIEKSCVSNEGDIEGWYKVGGFIGCLDISSDETVSIDQSFATGVVSSTSTSDEEVGGFIGSDRDGEGSLTISNCYFIGSVVSSYSDTYTDTTGFLGTCDDLVYTIEDCYTVASNGTSNLGFSYNTFDVTLSGLSYYTSPSSLTNSVGTNLSNDDTGIQDLTNFTDWDTSLWSQSSSVNSGYLYLSDSTFDDIY
jgi:hypothetical protein